MSPSTGPARPSIVLLVAAITDTVLTLVHIIVFKECLGTTTIHLSPIGPELNQVRRRPHPSPPSHPPLNHHTHHYPKNTTTLQR